MATSLESRAAYFVFIAVLGMLTAVTPLSIDMYLPAMPGLAREFAVNPAYVQYSPIYMYKTA